MTNLHESSEPPLVINEHSRWKNTKNGQIYRPLLRGMAWESEIGSIYPFPKGTEFTYINFNGLKMTAKI